MGGFSRNIPSVLPLLYRGHNLSIIYTLRLYTTFDFLPQIPQQKNTSGKDEVDLEDSYRGSHFTLVRLQFGLERFQGTHELSV